MSTILRDDLMEDVPVGSWETSGIESQRTIRSLDEPPEETAVQTFDDSIREPAENDVVLSVPLV